MAIDHAGEMPVRQPGASAPLNSPWLAAPPAWLTRRPAVTTDALALALSLFFTLGCNGMFWRSALDGRDLAAPATWLFIGAVGSALVAIHLLIAGLVLHRRAAKPVAALLIVTAALATYYMQRFGIFLDPSMLRNVLRTDIGEARELFAWSMVPALMLQVALPLLLLWRVRIVRRSWKRALPMRMALLAGAVVLLVGALLMVFQDVSALMRNQKELRYLITPANYLYSAVRVLSSDARTVQQPNAPVGTDATLAPAAAHGRKPSLMVLVVGETARAANWGLNGYARQTTPELAQLDVLNFRDVTSCGTNTETSVPCMFSAIGRRDYDEDRIRHSEGLLHVLHRAGYKVLWRDNQSGCKGVCDGLPEERLDHAQDPVLCSGDRCLDEILLQGLDTLARDAQGNLVVVLHMLGNHGPAYYNRYPEAFRRFGPTCDTAELRKCSQQEIVNAFDNALLYTDHVLARTIEWLKLQEAGFDTSMIYVSDHGESLGENGLYLHGMPYAIAPEQQTKVPMVWWLSKGTTDRLGLDRQCLANRAAAPAQHDHLFHSVLGLLQVQTSAYEPRWDLTAACRR